MPTARITRSAIWTGIAPTAAARVALTDFTARLIALRHRYETLRPARCLHGDVALRDGIADIDWFDQHGQPMTPETWGEPEARTLMLRRAAAMPDGAVEVTLVLLNADSADQDFALPEPALDWIMLLDTTRPELPPTPFDADHARLGAHGVMLLVGRLR